VDGAAVVAALVAAAGGAVVGVGVALVPPQATRTKASGAASTKVNRRSIWISSRELLRWPVRPPRDTGLPRFTGTLHVACHRAGTALALPVGRR
jgi:hypothetical protein